MWPNLISKEHLASSGNDMIKHIILKKIEFKREKVLTRETEKAIKIISK